VHDLINTFGLHGIEALDWYKRNAPKNTELGEEYRKIKNHLRLALNDPTGWLSEQPLGDQIEVALSLRRRQWAPLVVQLRQLDDSSTLSKSIEELCVSYVHLHLNRLGAAASEDKIMNFLCRSCESLFKAPVTHQNVTVNDL
jgi:thiopeptide-type bacteriocin biosynthesis protein